MFTEKITKCNRIKFKNEKQMTNSQKRRKPNQQPQLENILLNEELTQKFYSISQENFRFRIRLWLWLFMKIYKHKLYFLSLASIGSYCLL